MSHYVRIGVLLLIPCLMVLASVGCPAAEPLVGADLSFLPQMEQLGVEYRIDGQPTDPLTIFWNENYRLVRLRLWHSPTEPWHGTDSTLAFARRVVAAGYDLMLDFHCSDTWADPGQQTKPAAWEGLAFAALVDSVYAYTHEVISRFRAADVLPRYVQVGNEIGGGFLWDEGRVGWPGSPWDTVPQWSRFMQLLAAGINGVRDASPVGQEPEIVLHVANGGDNVTSRWFFDNVLAAAVAFDVIGVSFYPWWHGWLTDLTANLHDLAARYGKAVQVVEASYPWTLDGHDDVGNFVTTEEQLHPGYAASPGWQLHYLRDLLAIVRSANGGLGGALLYWEPAFLSVDGGPGNPHENLTLFDFDGDALPGLGFATPPDSSRYSQIQVVGGFNGWNTSQPPMEQVAASAWEDTLAISAGCYLLKFLTEGTWDVPFDFGGCVGEDPTCAVGLAGNVCLVAYPGTALGEIDFPVSGDYLFRLDERGWTYRITPLALADATAPGAGARPLSLETAPNPFNPRTEIQFTLPVAGSTRLTVHDSTGRIVAELIEEVLQAGEHTVIWDGMSPRGAPVASGTYLVRIESGGVVMTRKIVLLK